MISVIIPITEKSEDNRYVESVKKLLPGAFVVVGVTKDIKSDFNGVDVVNVFPEKTSKDAMLNSLLAETKMGSIIFLKDLKKMSRISELLVAGKDIVMFRKKKNDFALYFEDVKNWLSSIIFGFNIYRGDVGAVYISEKFADVMRSMDPTGVSLSTRVNRFAGAEIHYIEQEKKDFVKHKNEKKIEKHIWPVALTVLLLTGCGLLIGLCSEFFATNILCSVLIVFGILLITAFLIFFVLRLLIIIDTGELLVKQLDKIEQVRPELKNIEYEIPKVKKVNKPSIKKTSVAKKTSTAKKTTTAKTKQTTKGRKIK